MVTYRAGAVGHTGAGGFGHGLHRPYRDLPDVEPVAIADPDDEGRERAIEEAGAERGYANYRELLDREDLDVVSVCPRVTTEREAMVTAAAAAGCHVYCEKPFADAPAAADRMLDACDDAGVTVAVAHGSRHVEPFRTAREMVQSGDLGTILAMHGRGKEDGRGGGEDLLVLGTHTFDLMRFLVDADPAWTFGSVTVDGRDATRADAADATEPIGPVAGDAIHAMYGFPGGVRGYFRSVRDAQETGDRWGLSVVGTNGVLAIRWSAGLELLWDPSATGLDDCDFEPIEIEREPPASGADPPEGSFQARAHQHAVSDLLRAAEEGREPICSGRDGRFAVEMALGSYASHLSGERAALPLADRRHPLRAGTDR